MSDTPVGQPFTRVYLERGSPVADSMTFRVRLGAYLHEHYESDRLDLASYLRVESGIIVVTPKGYTDLRLQFENSPLEHVLDSITYVYRWFEDLLQRTHSQNWYGAADRWREFVERTLSEENVAYRIDAKGGMHYAVDEEFERNRVSALRAADGPRYGAVREAFERAFTSMDKAPPDTKGAVRAMFESLEILARLMVPGAQRLNTALVKGELLQLVLATTSDDTERSVLEKMMHGAADWVDGVHYYRHGQGTPEPIAPSPALAVHVLSTGAAVLRLWLQADAKKQGNGGV